MKCLLCNGEMSDHICSVCGFDLENPYFYDDSKLDSNKSTEFQRKIADQQELIAEEYCKNQNYASGIKWYTLAANRGNVSAQTHLGYMYLYGEGVPQNGMEAVKWYRRAAAQNDDIAEQALARIADIEAKKEDISFRETTKWIRPNGKRY